MWNRIHKSDNAISKQKEEATHVGLVRKRQFKGFLNMLVNPPLDIQKQKTAY